MIWEKKAQWSLTSMNELLNQCSFNSSEVHAQVMPVSRTTFQIQTAWKVLHSANCGEGNGNPLQYSCLENPRDRGAWGAASSGVAQSRTLLKWLSSKSKKASLMAQLIKNLPANARGVRDVGLIPGFGSSPGEGNDNHSSEKMWAEKKSQKCKSLKRSL